MAEHSRRASAAASRIEGQVAGYLNYKNCTSIGSKKLIAGARQRTWDEIAPFVYRLMGAPQRVLDPGRWSW